MTTTRTIPKVHDYKLIKSGAVHPEGSHEFEKDNFGPAIDAAIMVPELSEKRLTICVRDKDEDGGFFQMMVGPLAQLELGDKIVINDKITLVVQQSEKESQ